MPRWYKQSPAALITKAYGRTNRIVYRLSKGIGSAPYPKNISFPLTASCNYRCSFCEMIGVQRELKSRGKAYYGNEMTVEHVRPFAAFIQNAETIYFGGMTALGEPLFSSEFVAIVKLIRKLNRNANISLTTNGRLLSPSIVDLLHSSAPVSVTFSLHAATKETYAKTMGKAYAEVLENIKRFNEKNSSNSRSGLVSSSINFGLGKYNVAEAEAIVLLAKDLGVKVVQMYPYYKSPNRFLDDVSLYDQPDLANHALDSAYRAAKKIGVNMQPPRPMYLLEPLRPQKEIPYSGGCSMPFENFLLKSSPMRRGEMGFCVCNRIMLSKVSLEKRISPEDIVWMWNHPAVQSLRFPQKHIPEICQFCKHQETPRLRSLDHDTYKIKRDRAVEEFLSRWSDCRHSPNGSIELLTENPFSI